MKNMFSFFPKKHSNRLLGISLRQNSIAYCNVNEAQNVESVVNCENITSSSVDISICLTNLIEQYHLEGQCQLILASNQYHLIQVDKPDVPDAEINSALKWQIKELVPYSPENMIVDYFNGPLLLNSKEKINVVCADSLLLGGIVKALSGKNISLQGINVEEFAFARLLPFSDDAQLLVCQQPGEEILILIVKQRHIYFYRKLRGFAQIGDKSEEELANGIIDNLSLEIQKSTDYFERQLKQSLIKSINILIPIEKENYLINKLANNANVPVTLLALPDMFSNCREIATAVGATMTDDIPELSKRD